MSPHLLRRRVVLTVVVGPVIAWLVTACVGDPPPREAESGDELWGICELPAIAKISYEDLNPGLVEDGGPQNRTCAVAEILYGKAGCDTASVIIDERTECHGDYSMCCTLIHEAVHLRQFQRRCDICSAEVATGSFVDCFACLSGYCEPESEAAAYHAECQVSTACRAGGTGKDGQPPAADADLTDDTDPGLACFGEWFHCREVSRMS